LLFRRHGNVTDRLRISRHVTCNLGRPILGQDFRGGRSGSFAFV
jgi:hypothetical protein